MGFEEGDTAPLWKEKETRPPPPCRLRACPHGLNDANPQGK